MHAIHFPNKKAVGQAAAGKTKKMAVPNGKVKVTKSTGSSSNAKAGSKKPKPKSSKKATDAKKKRKAKVNVTPPPVNGRSAIIITESGFIKRINMLEFKTQSRGGKGKLGVRLGGDTDSVKHFIACNDYDTILFAVEKGVVFSAKAYYVPMCSRASKGRPIVQLLKMETGTQVSAVMAVDSFEDTETSILFLTANGFIKKTPLKAFENVTGQGLIAMGLNEGDTLKWARICQPTEDIIIASKEGFASRFPSKELTSTSRKSKGVKSMALRPGDELVDLSTITGKDEPEDADSFLLAVTERGYGKRIRSADISVTRRGCRGLILTKFKKTAAPKKKKGSGEGDDGVKDDDDMIIFQGETLDGDGEGGEGKGAAGDELNDALCSVRCCTAGDEVVLVTRRGTVMRQQVDDISTQSRNATGVLLQSTAKLDPIRLIDVVAPSSELDSVPVDLNILATVVAGH